jgi:hypothetical protein
MSSRSFETRSLPSSLATTHRGFAFYVAFPKSSIRPVGLAIYVARVPAAPFASRQATKLIASDTPPLQSACFKIAADFKK